MKLTDWKAYLGMGVAVGIAAASGIVAVRERLAAVEAKTESINKLWQHMNAVEMKVAALEAKP